MITNSTRIFNLSQLNFTKVLAAYTVDKIADEACMREKSSSCLMHKIILVLETDEYYFCNI